MLIILLTEGFSLDAEFWGIDNQSRYFRTGVDSG